MFTQLSTPEHKVMEALNEIAPASSARFADDTDVVAKTGLDIYEVRDWLDALESKGWIQTANSFDGHAARLNAHGRNALRDFGERIAKAI